MSRPTVLILDFGSQYTQLIARRIREMHVYCEIHPCTMAWSAIAEMDPTAVILSGGPASVYGDGAPTVDKRIFELGKPVLGICYGMQLTCHLLGGNVVRSTEREYGPATLDVLAPIGLLKGFAAGDRVDVWMSHGDRVEAIPVGFEVVATSGNSPFAAVADPARRIYGIQFHAEVAHTPRGGEMLSAFLFEVAGVVADWTPDAFVEQTIANITKQIGDGNAICGLSGGVDSSVASVLVSRAIGDRLTCIFVDNGLLRKNEAENVVKMFRDHFHLKLVHVDAAEEFLSALEGVTDPEKKRKIIGKIFIDVFEREAKKIEGARFLVQGTLYPDVIESVSHKGPSVVIKSHHNVGGLPENMSFALVEPLRLLFKDEVRAAGATMGIPHHVLWRQPFPGPGLAVRCPGEITREKLAILRDADAVLEEEIRAAGLYEKIWQSFCVILPVRTVGVQGDERTYDYAVAIRAVESRDGMTADWARIPHELLAKISTRIMNEVRGCNRVCYDISSKPPATIEWE
jgi:GMP synthase (glutamine-hydrolysing)